MQILLTIIAVVVIFSLLILIHEFGHFWAARRAGIKVEEFGFGFRPVLFKKKIGETVYSINAIPFGGFVKLRGEDSTDGKNLKDKRSFISKSPWVRTKVVVAGVLMNFILAILLLTIGFSFGIEPLLVTEDDLFANLSQGNVKSDPGIFVSKIADRVRSYGVNPGDKILAIDDKPIKDVAQINIFGKGKAEKDVDLTVSSAQGTRKVHVPVMDKYLGIDLKPFTDFPRLYISEVKGKSGSEKAGLKAGDAILKMNSEEVYFPNQFDAILTDSNVINFTVLRDNNVFPVTVNFPDAKRVVIADVFDKSAAQKAGLLKGDIVISIDGVSMLKPQQVQEILKKNPRKEMVYKLIRNGAEKEIKTAADEKNVLGVALSAITSFHNAELSVYRGTVITSITEIKKVSYGPVDAFKKAVSESVRLTGLTVSAFGRTITTMISKMTVPNEIGGPVQIAYYTHTFVQEGFFALLRFTAILSLSLAVINILPIPAVDGGRLLFIIVEVVAKRRVNARLEAMVHSIGFLLLILLIFLVTYNDIVKLF